MLPRFPHCSWYKHPDSECDLWRSCPGLASNLLSCFSVFQPLSLPWVPRMQAPCSLLTLGFMQVTSCVCNVTLQLYQAGSSSFCSSHFKSRRSEAFLDPPEEINCLHQALTVPIHFFQSTHHGLVLCICEISKGILSPLDCQVQWGQGAVSFTYCLSLETRTASGTSRIKFLAKETKRALHINF